MSIELFTKDFGLELWASNVPAGATMIANLASSTSDTGENISDVVAIGGKDFFLVTSLEGGQAGPTTLWVTDGTAAGTVDLGVQTSNLVQLSGGVSFTDPSGAQWVSDGTSAGTQKEPSDNGGGIAIVNGELFYLQINFGALVWDSNGTSAGTHQLSPPSTQTQAEIVFDGGFAFATVTEPPSTNELFFAREGTETTVGQYQGPGGPVDLYVSDATLFYTATAFSFGTQAQAQLWAWNGPSSSPVPMPSGLTPNTGVFTLSAETYFSTSTTLYATDGTGTAAGTTAILTGNDIELVGAVGGALLFQESVSGVVELALYTIASKSVTTVAIGTATFPFETLSDKGYFVFTPGNGLPDQLWWTDGTAAGTGQFDALSGVTALTSDGTVLTFNTDGQVWTSNGTVANTGLASDNAAPDFVTPAPSNDFNGDVRSEFLMENSSGLVAVGESINNETTYTVVSALGPEWKFAGTGEFTDGGDADFLIENSSGLVVVGDVRSGSAVYTDVGALGPEWKFVGTGDFLSDGRSDFLIENTSGAVVVGEVIHGAAVYTEVAGLGPEWKFEGSGNFLADGKSDFLIENSQGAVVVGEVANGSTTYTQVAALGPEWKFVGAGDYLGEGHDQFLIENSAGAVDIADWSGGSIHYVQVAALGPEWSFVGTGDYLGEGHDEFLIENLSGAVVVGDWSNGIIHYTQVAAVGPEWTFH